MTMREGFVPEEFLGQIRDTDDDGNVTGPWLDFARGTNAASYDWWMKDPGDRLGRATRRVVHWIKKENVIYGQADSPSYDVTMDPISPDFDPTSWTRP